MKFISLFVLVPIFAGMAGCGSNPPQPGIRTDMTLSIPEWYSNPPQNPDSLYAVAMSLSRDMQAAIDKAGQLARGELDSKLKAKTDSMASDLMLDIAGDDSAGMLSQLDTIAQYVSSIVIEGARIRDQEISVDNAIYRAYVMMELPVGEVKIALVEQIQNSPGLYQRLRSNESFIRLKNEAEIYEELKEAIGYDN